MGSCSSCSGGCGGGNQGATASYQEDCAEGPYDPKRLKKLSKRDEMMTYC